MLPILRACREEGGPGDLDLEIPRDYLGNSRLQAMSITILRILESAQDRRTHFRDRARVFVANGPCGGSVVNGVAERRVHGVLELALVCGELLVRLGQLLFQAPRLRE